MNQQAATYNEQNSSSCFPGKGNHKRNEQNNHAQTITAFNNSSHMSLIVEQIYCWFLGVWRNLGIKIQKKHGIFGLFSHQLRKPVNFKFTGIELVEITFVNKGQKQVSQQKLSQKQQKRFVVN